MNLTVQTHQNVFPQSFFYLVHVASIFQPISPEAKVDYGLEDILSSRFG